MKAKQLQPISKMQCRAARAALNWSANELAEFSGVGTTTISRFEQGHSKPMRANLSALRMTFEEAGIEFIEDHGFTAKDATPKKGSGEK